MPYSSESVPMELPLTKPSIMTMLFTCAGVTLERIYVFSCCFPQEMIQMELLEWSC